MARNNWAATVQWHATDEPEAYELAIGALALGPDSAMTVQVSDTDSTHTFTDLDHETQYGVWARKACRYTTDGYDTLVWSDWSEPVTFFAVGPPPAEGILEAGGEAFTLSPNPARGTVQVALPAAAVGGRLSLCDLAGRELEALSVTATTLTLDVGQRPAGVYLVKLVTPSGVSSRRLVVE